MWTWIFFLANPPAFATVAAVADSNPHSVVPARSHPRPYYDSLTHALLGLRLGNIVPDFSAETTQGKWESFHEWKKGQWAVCTNVARSAVPGP